MRLTDGKGVDAALDSIGGDITGEALMSVAPGGRVIQMGYPGGTGLTVNSLTLIWSALGAGGSTSIEGFNIYFQPPEAYAAAWGTVLPLLANGTVKPVIDRTYPLEEAAAATQAPDRGPTVRKGGPHDLTRSAARPGRRAGRRLRTPC